MRLENETLLENLKESSTELTKLNAENQTLIEEQALSEVQRERAERERLESEESIRKLTMELTEKKCAIDDLRARMEEGTIDISGNCFPLALTEAAGIATIIADVSTSHLYLCRRR